MQIVITKRKNLQRILKSFIFQFIILETFFEIIVRIS